MASNLNVSNEAIEKAVAASIAGQILDGIDPTYRDEILKKSIVEALTTWSVRGAVEKAVAAKAAEIASQLCETEEWSGKIAKALKEGFDNYLAMLKTNATKGWPTR